jgi:hypothetical protein
MLCAAALGATVAGAHPAVSSELPEFPGIAETIVSPDRDVTVSWQVKTGGSVSFRLYRGPHTGELELLAEEPAAPGLRTYRFRDTLEPFATVLYQLRLVTPGGHELSLATVRYVNSSFEPVPSDITSTSTDSAAIAAAPEIPRPGSRNHATVEPDLDQGFIPVPATPPPRRTAGPTRAVTT